MLLGWLKTVSFQEPLVSKVGVNLGACVKPNVKSLLGNWSGDPIRDKLRREGSCQAGLRGWLKKE